MRLRVVMVLALSGLGVVGPSDFRSLEDFGSLNAAEPKPEDKGPARVGYAKQVMPILQKYCVTCHKGEKPRAGFNLDKITTDEQAVADRKTWEKVIHALDAREMPPDNKPQPTAAERDPGRVTVRRLNRVEYNNTIRDLVGVNFQPADDFPADDVGYGFDNIGDVLTVSPLLMEKYLAAAERIVDLSLTTRPEGPPARRYARRDIQSTTADRPDFRSGTRKLSTNGEVYVEHNFPRDGEYIFRVRAYGDQAGNEPVKMAFRLDGKDLKTFDVRNRSDRAETFMVKMRVEAGKRKFAAAFLNDFTDANATDPQKKERNLYAQFLEVEGPMLEGREALSAPMQKIFVVLPGKDVSKDDAARKIVEAFARRAFRRPVKPGEVEKYLKLFKQADADGQTFERSVGLALQGILVSPHFLFRFEKDQTGEKGPYLISEHELAARLSYFLWSTMPDDELATLADKGELRKNLEAQVRRMLKDDKSRALVDNFGGQWLQWRNLRNFNPDAGTFPDWDESLRQAMMTEAELFFGAVVKEDRSLLDLLDSDFTFVNERLARHYGISGIRGQSFQRVSLKDNPRGGVLTMGSTLTVTSNPTRTSPVKRGKWILENILNAPPPPPPPGAGELSEEKKVVDSASLRQRMELHRSKPECAQCHSRLDPLGFGFENFDAIGAFRSKDGKFDVDASGVLPGGEKFNGAKELKSVLKQRKDEFARCAADRMLTYALGRGLEYNDRCVVDDAAKALAKDDYKFSRLVMEIVKSDPFQKRGPVVKK